MCSSKQFKLAFRRVDENCCTFRLCLEITQFTPLHYRFKPSIDRTFFTKKQKSQRMKQGQYLPLGIALGVAFGTTLGVITDNLGLWMGVGIAIGAGLGTALSSIQKSNNDSNSQE